MGDFDSPPAARFAQPCTPSDATIYAPGFTSIYVAVTGILVVRSLGVDVTFTNVAAGVVHRIAGTQVRAASSATGIVLGFGT